MKLFITGAAGFVGAAVARAAVFAGHDVIAAIRPGSAAERILDIKNQITLLPLDLLDKEQIYAAIGQYVPDVIVHIAWAGVGNQARFERFQISYNIESACMLVEAAIKYRVQKFVGIGSQGEYGPINRKITENDLPHPTSLYGAAKLSTYHLTRQIAAQGDLSHSWLRLFSTYGPQDNEGWLIPMLVKEMLAGRRPKCTLGTQFWDYLYIDDLAKGILAVSTASSANGLFNIGSGSPVRVRNIVETIRDVVSPDMPLIFGEVPFRPDQIMHMEADISKLKKTVGWKPMMDIRSGLEQTIEWYRTQV